MATPIKTLLVKFDADTSSGVKGIQDINREAKNSEKGFGSAKSSFMDFVKAQALIAGVKEAWHLVTDAVGDFITQAETAQNEMAQTNAVLASTKGISGETAGKISDMVDEITNFVPVSDEAVRSGANMLLTFTGIGAKGGIFDQSTMAAVNMATAFNNGVAPSAGQVQNMALQLGKALNDPLRGMQALRREGVTFSTEQENQIKHFMAVNDRMDAQKVMLDELQKEFGKAGQAAGQTLSGQLTILGTKFDNVKQTVGLALMPVFQSLLDKIIPLADQFGQWLPGAMSKFQGFIDKNVMPVVGKLSGWFFKDGLPALKQFGAFILNNVIPTLLQMADWVEKNVVPALEKLAVWVQTKVIPVIAQMWTWADKNVVPVFKTIATIIFTDVVPALQNIWSHIAQNLIPAIQGLWEKLSPILIPVLNTLGWIFKNVLGPALSVIIDIISGVINVVSTLIGWIQNLFGWIGKVAGSIGDFFGKVGAGAHALHIPGFASGTEDAPGGLAQVHKDELIFLPAHSKVMPSAQSRALMDQAGQNLLNTVAGQGSGRSSMAPTYAHVHVEVDGQRIVQVLAPLLVDEIRRATGTRAA